MILRDRMVGFALCMLALCPLAAAGDEDRIDDKRSSTPLVETEHSVNTEKRRKRYKSPEIETPSQQYLDLGLRPLNWPKDYDLRARILPGVKDKPLIGWLAANLYRSKRENGWCLEVDPGEGEYLVFYRRNL